MCLRCCFLVLLFVCEFFGFFLLRSLSCFELFGLLLGSLDFIEFFRCFGWVYLGFFEFFGCLFVLWFSFEFFGFFVEIFWLFEFV